MPLRFWTTFALIGACAGFSPVAAADSSAQQRPARSQVRATPAPATGWEALWGNRWWPVELIDRREGLTKIHYTGWGSEWDEWVEPSRLRKAAPRVALRAGMIGQRVDVEWHGNWWNAEIIAVRAGLYKVHYVGWGNEWDEWVEPIRLRKRSR
jgi:hypothetical protein